MEVTEGSDQLKIVTGVTIDRNPVLAARGMRHIIPSNIAKGARVEHSQKVFLALCVLVAVFLSTNLMLVPLLRRPRENRRSSTGKALGALFKIGGGAPDDAMEELGRRVEHLKQDPPSGEEDQD